MLAPLLLVPLVLRGALNTGVVISIFFRSLAAAAAAAAAHQQQPTACQYELT
jgi:hypothetical protein